MWAFSCGGLEPSGEVVELARAHPVEEGGDLGAGVDQDWAGRVTGVADGDPATGQLGQLDASPGRVAGRALAPPECGGGSMHVQMLMHPNLRMQERVDTMG